MSTTWKDIEDLAGRDGHLGVLALQPGATQDDLDALERHLGVGLPRSVREFLAVHDGQGHGSTCLFFHSIFLGVEGIRGEWDNWRTLDEDEMNAACASSMASSPPGVIRPMYTNRRWIPLTHDGGGYHVGLDFDPDVAGHPGQVISFGRDEDTKRLIAPDFDAFLDLYAEQLRSGTWTLTAEGWDYPPRTRNWP